MKFQKLDPKQVPQVIALVVLCVGVVGWGAFSMMSAAAPATAPAAKQPRSATKGARTETKTASTDPTAPLPGPEAAALMNNPLAQQLPPLNNPDPFQPSAKLLAQDDARNQGPSARIRTPGRGARGSGSNPPPRPLPPAGTAAPAPAPSPSAAPAAPVRPKVVVTGIIDAEDDQDMALLALDQEGGPEPRVAMVGDVLPFNYRVKRIAMNGIWLVNGRDLYFVELTEMKTERTASQ